MPASDSTAPGCVFGCLTPATALGDRRGDTEIHRATARTGPEAVRVHANRRRTASEHQYLGPYRAFLHECCRYPHLCKRRLDLQEGAARRRGGVHGRVERAEPDAALAELVDEGDELAGAPSEPASSQGLYPGLRQGRILGWALRTNPRRIEVEGPHVGALRGIEASLREEREGSVPEAGAPFRGRVRSHGATHRGRRR